MTIMVTVGVAAYSPAPGKGFPGVTALLGQGKVSPGKSKSLQFCSCPLDYNNNSNLPGEGFPGLKCYSPALLPSAQALKGGCHPNLMQRFTRREESRRVAASARVEEDGGKVSKCKT
ncbi:hypothetical protein I79_008852 [Cricetulus griseus]|uniref:Uncharacterized protein n=1 Tax=Cricetulus griseus TaxID=10029 RepID=G3HE76_CRIGR|nr:hypothetical protein I79_008852 [Cricetulus griseus]